MREGSYIIGSGWWCDEGGKPDRECGGDDAIRSSSFHHLWYASVNTFARPEKIVIVDSASPVPPPLQRDDARIEYLRLRANPGHSTAHTGPHCGWTASVLLGLEYAHCCDVEYFVYVEQDVLLWGEKIVETCIARMQRPYMFGSGDGTAHPLQQSFFVVHRSRMAELVHNVQRIRAIDRLVSPEKKFCMATSPVLMRLPLWLFVEKRHWSERSWLDRRRVAVQRALLRAFGRFDTIPFGYGGYRTRGKIDFDDAMFYFQHGERSDIEQYVRKYEQQYGRIDARLFA
jgi:hypothetical protein